MLRPELDEFERARDLDIALRGPRIIVTRRKLADVACSFRGGCPRELWTRTENARCVPDAALWDVDLYFDLHLG